MKALLILIIAVVAACGRESADVPSPQGYAIEETVAEEPEAAPFIEEPAEDEQPEPPLPLVTAEGIVWLVPPMFEYDHISYCGHCGFVNSWHDVICPITGVVLDYAGHGIGSPPPIFVYDPVLDLFGEPWFGHGYDTSSIGMYPFDMALELFSLDGFHVIQTVDSTIRDYTGESYFEGEIERFWQLSVDAYLNEFAVMYNGEFVTDFIFDRGLHPELWNWREWDFDSVAVRKDGMWGTIDRYGNTLAPFIFNQISYFDESSAIAVYNGKHGLIDRYGNVLIPFLYDEIYQFGTWFSPDRIAAVYNGKHGLIDENGNMVIPFLFDHLFNIDGNTAFAKYNGLYGIIDVHQTEANVALNQR